MARSKKSTSYAARKASCEGEPTNGPERKSECKSTKSTEKFRRTNVKEVQRRQVLMVLIET